VSEPREPESDPLAELEAELSVPRARRPLTAWSVEDGRVIGQPVPGAKGGVAERDLDLTFDPDAFVDVLAEALERVLDPGLADALPDDMSEAELEAARSLAQSEDLVAPREDLLVEVDRLELLRLAGACSLYEEVGEDDAFPWYLVALDAERVAGLLRAVRGEWAEGRSADEAVALWTPSPERVLVRLVRREVERRRRESDVD
jgi:hypothetical protein